MQDPRKGHWDAAMRVLRYIKGSPAQGIVLPKTNSLLLTGFCDSDWASCPMTRRSLSGYTIYMGQSPVSWKCKKQSVVSRSSAEAEYPSMANATSELIWLRSILQSLEVPHTPLMSLLVDTKAALQISANPVQYERTKHVEIDCHFVRE